MFALHHVVPSSLAQKMVTFVLVTVTTTILARGMSMRPLMKRYAQRVVGRHWTVRCAKHSAPDSD
jgi:hypothetical protein